MIESPTAVDPHVFLNAQPSFLSIVNSVHSLGHSFMTECPYGTTFESNECVDGSSLYTNCFSRNQPFRPVIFGEVKEILHRGQVQGGWTKSPVATLNLGLPKLATNLVDTFFWNQLAELDYGMRRESADNDSQVHMLPDEGYIPLDYLIPWSQGPLGEPSDRIFTQIAFDCHIQRSLPSTISFPARLPSRSFSSSLNESISDFITATSSISAVGSPLIGRSSSSTSHTPHNRGTDSNSEDLDFDDFSYSTVCDWRSISVGDFVVIVCDLSRVDYPHLDNFVRVYTITALALNIVV
ncbi:hypothetical protein B0H11DRAFT_2191818 [Mycena galericulata]|nr:hypothetical protein B0H11DRAFT_2191818 [Mycena galericulata]